MSNQEPRRSDGDQPQGMPDAAFLELLVGCGVDPTLGEGILRPAASDNETDTPSNELDSKLNDCVKNFIDIAQNTYDNPTRQNIETYQLHYSTIVQELKRYVRAMRNSIPDDNYEGIVEMVSDVSTKICEINDSLCRTFSRITGKDYVLSTSGDAEDNQEMIMAAEENTDSMVSRAVEVFRMMLDDDMQSFREILEQRYSISPRGKTLRVLRVVGGHALGVMKIATGVAIGITVARGLKSPE